MFNIISDAFESLKAQYNLVELAEGKPNFGPPNILRNALVDAATGNYSLSQYSPVFVRIEFFEEPRLVFNKYKNSHLGPSKATQSHR